ncbi:hypothetical protein [Polaromonas sp.]|uniref:hypothetical protein n=1 Tax=Polaromonas sp. TaxID=1869339 RepID=UPI003266080D
MTPHTLWIRYARIWSADPVTRDAELEICLHDECSYCDVNGLLEGRAALSAYMGGFQDMAPGAHFHILSVAEHHGRCLCAWELRDVNNSVLQTGRSFAVLHQDGRLQHITGFFDSAA